jgi:hypothetical protein
MAIFRRRGGGSKKAHDITATDLGIIGLRHATRSGDSSPLRKLT